jgi:hypothetical protein
MVVALIRSGGCACIPRKQSKTHVIDRVVMVTIDGWTHDSLLTKYFDDPVRFDVAVLCRVLHTSYVIRQISKWNHESWHGEEVNVPTAA